MVTIRSTDSQGANVGGTLGLGGSYGAGLVNYGLIRGAKETSTNNDSNGYMSFTVHSSAGQVERMRIRSTGAATLTKTGSGVNDPNLSIINSDAAGHEASIYFNTQHSSTDYGWKCGMNIETTTFAIGLTINSSGIMSDKLAISSGGNVTITGTTHNQLTIKDNASYMTLGADDSVMVGMGFNRSSTEAWFVGPHKPGATGITNEFHISRLNGSWSHPFVIKATGYVGIGTILIMF